MSSASQDKAAWPAAARPGDGRAGDWQPGLPALTAIMFVLLMLPALINGAPILYPDSWGYISAGDAALNAAGRWLGLGPDAHAAGAAHPAAQAGGLGNRAANGISSIRSPYYGALLVLCQRLAGPWGIVVLQSVIAAFSSALVLRRLVISRALLAVALFALLLTGGGFFTGALLPDALSAPTLLAMALLASGVAMAGWERAWWAGVLLLGLLFHKAHLAALAALLPLALWPALRRGLGRWPLLLALFGLSLAAHFAVNAVVERQSGQKILDPPVLLARVIADGPGARHLAAHCPAAGYAICAWKDRLHDDANQLLWSRDPQRGFYALLSLPEKRRITAEANGIVLASIAEYPGQQLISSLRQFGRQLVTVGVTELDLNPERARQQTDASLHANAPGWETTAIGRDAMPLQLISRIMLLVYLLVVVPALVLLALSPASNGSARLAVWLLAGLVMNAAVNAVLAGVFDRYQGRVAGVAVLALLAVLASRRLTDQPAAGLRAAR